MITKTRHRQHLGMSLFFAATLATSCGKDDSSSGTTDTATAGTTTTETNSDGSTTTSTTNTNGTVTKTTTKTDGTKTTTVAAGTSTPTTSTVTAVLNSLAKAVPANLNLSAFSKSTSSTSLALATDSSASGEGAGKPPEVEIKENLKILSGSASSCLAESFGKDYKAPTDETCYEFDSDMVLVKNSGAGPGGSKTLGAKKGVNSSGEACLVAFARSQLVKIKDPLTRAQNILNAALCQATKDEKAKVLAATGDDTKVDLIPANVGDSLDLAPALKNAMAKAARTKEKVTSIKMTRLADVSDLKVYQTVFTLTDDQENTRLFTLNHSPKDTNNEEYSGILYFAVKPPKGKADPQAGPGATPNMVFYVSISYVRTKNTDGTFTMNYEARSARFAKEIDPILSTGLLDYNANADFTSATTDVKYGSYKNAAGSFYAQNNEAANGFSNINVSNTESSTGELKKQVISFWVNPGSNYGENARGMVFSVAPNSSTGVMEGCSTSGTASVDMTLGTSIRRVIKEGATDTTISLSPRGFYHPFINTDASGTGNNVSTNGSGDYKYKKSGNVQTVEWAALAATGTDAETFVTKQVGALMTSQCFKQDATSGLYVVDTSKTTGADGFDIVKTTDTVKFITPPERPKPKMSEATGKFKPSEITAAATGG